APVAAAARRTGFAAGTGYGARFDRPGQPPDRPPAAADQARPRAAALNAGGPTMDLVLASTSRYRRELLRRLRLPFDTASPHVDETPLAGEEPAALVQRLARAKATAVANSAPGAWVIGSDQVAELDGAPLGKPGGREAALAQLTSMSRRAIRFHTAVALVREGGGVFEALDLTTVHFRRLDAGEIGRYVDAE